MIENRSVPNSSVIPELAYGDVLEAADWLCTAFGFRTGFASEITAYSSPSATAP